MAAVVEDIVDQEHQYHMVVVVQLQHGLGSAQAEIRRVEEEAHWQVEWVVVQPRVECCEEPCSSLPDAGSRQGFPLSGERYCSDILRMGQIEL